MHSRNECRILHIPEFAISEIEVIIRLIISSEIIDFYFYLDKLLNQN